MAWAMIVRTAIFDEIILDRVKRHGVDLVLNLAAGLDARLVLPLTAPGLAATALLSLIFSWNEFLMAVNLTAANAGTLPVFISGFQTSEGLFFAKMSAASTLAVAPVILAGWLAQRSLVRGLTFGAVK